MFFRNSAMTAHAPFFISCIVPARNEEGNIAKVVDALSPALASSPLIRDYEIIIVNDNSTDSTGRLIDSLAEKDHHIHPVHRTTTPGFGNAVKSGMAEAKGDIIIPFMGDLSDNPRDIPRLVERIGEGYDVAYGSRFVEGGSLNNYPRAKLIANRAFNNLVRLSFGMPNRDITNAFKAYRKEVIDTIGIENLESSGFDLTVEIPIKAHILGFRSSEVPVSWYDRTAGEAKLKLSRNGSIYGRRFMNLFFYGNLVALKDLFRFFVKGSWLGIILAMFFGIMILAFLFTLTGFSTIFSLLEKVSLFWILLSCTAILFSFVMRTWRWSVLLRSAGYVYPRDILFKCLMFSWFLNYLIPARLGDIARAVALKTTSDAPFGMTLSTIVIERIYDMVTLALLLGIASLFFFQSSFVYIEIGAFALIAAMFFVLFIIYRYDETIIRFFECRFPTIRQSLVLLKEGLANIVRNPGAMALCFILSFPVWLLEIASIFFAARSIGYDLSFVYATTAGVVAFLAQALPLTPAGLGIHEASITGVLMLFSVPSATGMSIALVDHFARGLVIFIFGLIATIHIAFASRWYFRTNGSKGK
jgi:uncharacterized protein (TIRG00374 family)